ncbi:TIGR04388 family protein [Leptospira andrefontaineae]|uniref:TIGR04388 family protein n=2 Tax=Leptospira andrefontaineae TaxID=2484976 RepID=A0A4V3JGG9_9LEPT|nr:TIGR04388 family protein [Leptospira andrefontaineae]
MDATLLYASNQMMNFLNNELGVVQDALQDLINGGNGGGTYLYGDADDDRSYGNTNCLSSGNLCGEDHPEANITSPNYVSISDLLNGNSGNSQIGNAIMAYLDSLVNQDGKFTMMDLVNSITNAYSDSLLATNDPLRLLNLSTGSTITGISDMDLVAFNPEIAQVLGITAYCPDWAGCYSGNLLNPGTGIYGANQSYYDFIVANGSGDFYDYIAREAGGWTGIPLLLNVPLEQSAAWVQFSYSTQNNNTSANATTYQDMVIQLQGFQYNWVQNVMPSITNWVAQVANYQAQYDNWQIEKAEAIAEAQSTYSQGVSDLQEQEAAWMASMTSTQNAAEKAFNAAENALRDAKGQGNYDSLYQQIMAGLNQGKGGLNANSEASADLVSYTEILANLSKGLNDKSTSAIPDSTLLSNFANNFSNLVAGVSNLSLLSATNNSVMDSTANYMLSIADSMKNEKTFKQNAVGKLLEANKIETKEVDGETYVLDSHGKRIAILDDNNEQKKDCPLPNAIYNVMRPPSSSHKSELVHSKPDAIEVEFPEKLYLKQFFR